MTLFWLAVDHWITNLVAVLVAKDDGDTIRQLEQLRGPHLAPAPNMRLIRGRLNQLILLKRYSLLTA